MALSFLCNLLVLAISLAHTSEISLHEKIKDAAFRSSLDPKLVEAVIKVESNYKPRATSNKGAMGLMQVMPQTADACEIHDPYHAVNNVMGACECLRRLINRYQGNLKLALAAYNAGPTSVERYGGIPPFKETMEYVKKVLRIYSDLREKTK
jgi:soluble lytic murein transglycosylase-like protein